MYAPTRNPPTTDDAVALSECQRASPKESHAALLVGRFLRMYQRPRQVLTRVAAGEACGRFVVVRQDEIKTSWFHCVLNFLRRPLECRNFVKVPRGAQFCRAPPGLPATHPLRAESGRSELSSPESDWLPIFFDGQKGASSGIARRRLTVNS